jgi:glycine dehydrogenase
MPRTPLSELEQKDDFIRRHIGPAEPQVAEMLATLGVSSIEELIDKTVPAAIRTDAPLDVPENKSERYTLSVLRRMSERNQVFISMIGMGYYGTTIPNVILRNVMENPGWYTAYTPYQPEVSQGRLEALLNYQQMVIDMTGMDMANASLLDEATAAAEAMSMARRISKKKDCDTFFVDEECHPQTIAVMQTRAKLIGFDLIVGDPWSGLEGKEIFGVLMQYPASTGEVKNPEPVIASASESGIISCVATDLLSLALLKPPGEMGADIVLGSSQRFGVPMGYGGPHAAFFATKDTHKRQIPGRIIGVSVDTQGHPALRMALQTREQHIRREKANSNICTAQVLLAVLAGFYAVYHGPDGIKRIASKVHRMACITADGLRRLGVDVSDEPFFDTIRIRVPGQAARLAAKARESRINVRVIDPDHLGISLDETTRRRNINALWKVFGSRKVAQLSIDAIDDVAETVIPDGLQRITSYLEHPTFTLYHSETEMLRYLRWLQAKDIALDRAMIPLGSCTMKLNATTQMIPVTWRNFSAMHPFAPLDQAQGYQQLFEELEEQLAEITGFDAVSLQPNAGSQGEFSGLAVIAKYHDTRGDGHRNVCLIPSSSHGTNPASAQMAGMRVIVVGADGNGNVDLADLNAKAAEHSANLAALMITYPSTHGVFEEAIVEICAAIHNNGGQVYLDGANMNALVGLAKPGEFGADVMHLNLHKTFAIPHGGGGRPRVHRGPAPHQGKLWHHQ